MIVDENSWALVKKVPKFWWAERFQETQRELVKQVPSPAFKCNVMSSTGEGLYFTSSPSLREAWTRPSFLVQCHRNSNDTLGRQLPKPGGALVWMDLIGVLGGWGDRTLCWHSELLIWCLLGDANVSWNFFEMYTGIRGPSFPAPENLILLRKFSLVCASIVSVLLYLKPLLPREFHCLVATAW